MEAVFQDCVRKLKAEGRTVLLSSHILAEVEALCDRVTIVRAGRAVRSGTLAELRSRSRTSVSALTDRPASDLESLAGVTGLLVDGCRAVFTVDDDHLADAMQLLIGHGLRAVTASRRRSRSCSSAAMSQPERSSERGSRAGQPPSPCARLRAP